MSDRTTLLNTVITMNWVAPIRGLIELRGDDTATDAPTRRNAVNRIAPHPGQSEIEAIERTAWFARLALGEADPRPVPQPRPHGDRLDRDIAA